MIYLRVKLLGDELVCNGSEVFYTADFHNTLNYDWFISGNGNLTQVSNSAVVQWQEAGTATIGLIPFKRMRNWRYSIHQCND